MSRSLNIKVDALGLVLCGAATMTIQEAAREVQASVLGDPPHYLMTAEQLEQFVALVREGERQLPALPY